MRASNRRNCASPARSGGTLRIVCAADQLGAAQWSALTQEFPRTPLLFLVVADQVQNQVDTGTLANDVVLQEGVKPVVLSSQLRRETDNQREPFEARQRKHPAQLRERKKYPSIFTAILSRVDLEPETCQFLARFGAWQIFPAALPPQQPFHFRRRDVGSPRHLPLRRPLALQRQRARSQPDQQIEPAQFVGQMFEIVGVRARLRGRRHGVTSKRNVRRNRLDTSTRML